MKYDSVNPWTHGFLGAAAAKWLWLVFAWFPVLFVFSASPARAAEEQAWFTIVGDAKSPFAETVEVDAASAVAFETMRLVKIRVNRSSPRTAFDGKPYHSYYSTAVVDCTALKAWHRSVSLFSKPLWQGQMRQLEYTESDGRYLAFADMWENPINRLIKAACAIALPNK